MVLTAARSWGNHGLLPPLLHGLHSLWPLQGAHLSKAVYRNGLFLGGKPTCLGQLPCQVRLPKSKRRRRIPLAGPDPLTVIYEATAE